MQIDAIQAELPDCQLLYKISMPGVTDSISIQRLVTFTGRRFLNSFALHPNSQEQTDISPERATLASAPGPLAAASQLVSEHQSGTDGSAGSCQAPLRHLFAIMSSQAPALLSIAELEAVVQEAQPCLAHDVLNLLPVYLAATLQDADKTTAQEVCTDGYVCCAPAD
jgi:hypothetical protein